MGAFVRSILLLGRYFKRIADSLEKLARLYELELKNRDIYDYVPNGKADETQLIYGVKQDENEW